MEFGLRRIILIDSYVEGMASEIDVSGHTNISGGNGTGKTSFLRLIPIFYGEKPSRLVIASGNGNLSFNDYYLKRSGSYIVFEYLNHGEPRMVVFCNRASDNRHRHVFIDSGYREDIFMDVDNGVILPAHELLTRLSGANISHLNVDTTQNYRQILLDGTVPKAQHFSMCPRNGKMSQLTPLFTGMFKRDAQFADLSKVIQEYAMDKLDDESRKILRNFSPHRDHLNTTLTQYDAYQALDKVKSRSDLLQATHEDHRAAKRQLSASIVAAKGLSTSLDIKLRAIDRDIESAKSLISEEETNHINESRSITQLIEKIDDELGPKTAEKSGIENEYRTYVKSDLPAWEEKLANLDSIKNERATLQSQYNVLADASAEIRKPIEAEIWQAKILASSRVQEIDAQRGSLGATYKAQRSKMTQGHIVAVREQTAAQQAQLEGELAKLNVLAIQISRLEERQSHPQPSPELSRQLEIVRGNRDKSQVAFETAQDEQTNSNDAVQKATVRYNNADIRFTKSHEHSEEIETELLEVQSLITGDEDTLIHFLNVQRPGWEDTLGRILQPDVLRRKNLSPTIDEKHAGAKSLFGIDIDFSKLPEQELTPAALLASHEELSRELISAEQDCLDAEKELNKAYANLDEANDRLKEARADFRTYRTRLTKDRDMFSQIQRQVDKSVHENAQRTKDELALARTESASAETALGVLKANNKAAVTSLAKAHETELDAFDTEHDNQIKSLAERSKALTDELETEIERLTRQMEQILSGEGINPAEMNELDQRVQKLSTDIEEIQRKEVTIRSFKEFMETRYNLLGALKEDIAGLEKTKAAQEAAAKDMNARWERRVSELRSTIDGLEKTKAKDASDMDALRVRVLTSSEGRELAVSDQDSTLALYREMSPQSLINEYVKWVQAEADLLRTLKKLGDEFAFIFERYPGTPSTQYWQEAAVDWDGTDERTMTRAKAVVDYYQGGKHAIVFESLIKGFGNLDQIEIYRGAMEAFNSRIRRFNTELKQHMARSLTFKSLSDIEPTVAFELDELDYWKDIKSLADGVRSWRDEGGLNSMPGDDLVMQLRSYLETFEESRANVSVDELWRLIRFRFTLLENGKTKTVTNTKDLSGDASVSSNGLSYLVLIVVFLGFVDMQRRGQPVNLTWALDELRAFDNDNKRALLDLLTQHDISLVTACPDMEDRELSVFHRVYKLEGYKSGLRFIRWTMPPVTSISPTNPFLVDETE
jgi:hypothetical protein